MSETHGNHATIWIAHPSLNDTGDCVDYHNDDDEAVNTVGISKAVATEVVVAAIACDCGVCDDDNDEAMACGDIPQLPPK